MSEILKSIQDDQNSLHPLRLRRIVLRMTLGLLLLIPLLSTAALALAEEKNEAPPSQTVEQCLGEHPSFKKDQPFSVDDDRDLNTPLQFRAAFEEARNKYHSFIRCLFDTASAEILDSEEIDDLNDPEDACLEPGVLNRIAVSVSSKALMSPALKAYNAYAEHLKTLQTGLDQNLHFRRSLDEGLDIEIRKTKDLVTNEIQNSLTVLHTSLAKLMEMRQVFIMHVHFECMLLNLEDYRVFLSELRSVIELLPDRIIDASVTK